MNKLLRCPFVSLSSLLLFFVSLSFSNVAAGYDASIVTNTFDKSFKNIAASSFKNGKKIEAVHGGSVQSKTKNQKSGINYYKLQVRCVDYQHSPYTGWIYASARIYYYFIDQEGNAVYDAPSGYESGGISSQSNIWHTHSNLNLAVECHYSGSDYDFYLTKIVPVRDFMDDIVYGSQNTYKLPGVMVTPQADLFSKLYRLGGYSVSQLNSLFSQHFPIESYGLVKMTNTFEYYESKPEFEKSISQFFEHAIRYTNNNVSVLNEFVANIIAGDIQPTGWEGVLFGIFGDKAPSIISNGDFLSGTNNWDIVRTPSTVPGRITIARTGLDSSSLIMEGYHSTRTASEPKPILAIHQLVNIPAETSIDDLVLRVDYNELFGESGAFGPEFSGTGVAGVAIKLLDGRLEPKGYIEVGNAADNTPGISDLFFNGPISIEEINAGFSDIWMFRNVKQGANIVTVDFKNEIQNYLSTTSLYKNDIKKLDIWIYLTDATISAANNYTGERNCTDCKAKLEINKIQLLNKHDISQYLLGRGPVGQLANLESPLANATESGIGLIRGWVCDADRVDIVIDNGAFNLEAGYGTFRADTKNVCGDEDNGFGLTFNWNRLGDGQHTLRALADGVEFANLVFTVKTLGVEYLKGVQGEYLATNFLGLGQDVVLRWSEPHQNFVLAQNINGGSGLIGDVSHMLESPQVALSESGIGLIRGWVCDAQRIDIVIDNGLWNLVPAYGTSRPDTISACGDENNGFGLTFNWNVLGDGIHTLRASADGVIFANVQFYVKTLGVEFLTGISGGYILRDFPQPGQNVIIQWVEPHQNMIIVGRQ